MTIYGPATYPGPPIAEIVTVSEGNILGNTDFTYVPTMAKPIVTSSTSGQT